MSGRMDPRQRSAVWRAHGATSEEADELVAYAASPLPEGELPAHRYPLPDGAHIATWRRYVDDARTQGAFAVLRRVLIQLRFPVQEGVSGSPTYQAATRRGVWPDDAAPGLRLVHPGGLRVFLHPTPAGHVPAIVAEAREDFEALVQAVTARNEPEPVPASMGACLVAGYNNWDRVRELRRAWEAKNPGGGDAGWAAALREIVPHKDRYQDRFMLLSSGPYSATPASAVGLPEAAWRERSVRLRLEHECTHFFMRQAFGAMRKSLLDELVADYMGLVEALGSFRVECFLHFMGLESHPYRAGGRLENYRGAPPLSDGAFLVLQGVARKAAEALGRLDPSRHGGFGSAAKARVITALTRVGLEGLASPAAAELLREAFAETDRAARASASEVAAAG
jgi:hypothetical protein